jgi:hypothetical protein
MRAGSTARDGAVRAGRDQLTAAVGVTVTALSRSPKGYPTARPGP